LLECSCKRPRVGRPGGCLSRCRTAWSIARVPAQPGRELQRRAPQAGEARTAPILRGCNRCMRRPMAVSVI